MEVANLKNILEKVKPWPWRQLFYVVGSGFVLASLVTSVGGLFVAPTFNGVTPATPEGSVSEGAGGTSADFPMLGLVSLDKTGVDAVLQRNIFDAAGSAKEDAKRRDQDPNADMVKSDLPLKLIGTIYGGTPQTGIAIVENTQKNSTASFLVGDMIVGSAKMLEVQRERIVIDNNGRREFVDLEKPELVRSTRKRGAVVAGQDGGSMADSPIATAPPPEQYKEDGFERKGGDIVMSSSYREKMLTTDFSKVLQDAKATPNVAEGELKGFSLEKIRQDSIWQKAGFQNGDVVQEINGIPLSDAAQAIKLLQSLRNEKEIEVRLQRSGGSKTLNLNVR